MIKKFFLLGIIVATLFSVYIITKNPIIHYIREKQIESDLLNFFNRKGDKHISEEGKKIYNKLINIGSTKINISLGIEYYLNIIDEVFQSKCYSKEIQKVKWPKDNEEDTFYRENIHLGSNGSITEIQEFKELQKSIDDNEFENYSYNNFKTDLVKELEKILEHRDNSIYKGWYMDVNESKVVELPYNCYIEYKNGGEIDFANIEKVYKNSNFVKCELKKTDNNFSFDNARLYAKLTYSENNQDKYLYPTIKTKKLDRHIIITPIPEVFYIDNGKSTLPYIVLKSHDIDEYHEQGNSSFRWDMIRNNDLKDIDSIILIYINNLYDVEHRPYKEIEVIINKILDIYNESKEEGLSKVEIDKKIFNGLGLTISKDNLYAQWHTLTSIAWIGANAENDDVKIILNLSAPYEDMYFKFSEIIEEIKKMEDDGVSQKDILLYAYDEIRKENNMLLAWLPRSALE